MNTQASWQPNDIQKVFQTLTNMGIRLRMEKGQLRAGPANKINRYARTLINSNRPGLVAILSGKKVNDFQESLEKGDNPLVRAFLKVVYTKAFYNLVGIIHNDSGDSVSQQAGCDTIIYLTNNIIVRIDEKIRYKHYGDIGLEYISSDRSKTPGWMGKDLGIDYLNYVIYPEKQAFLFPWQSLKKVWAKNKVDWLKLAQDKQDNFYIASAPNNTYNTLLCCIPTSILIGAVQDAMIITLPKNWKP